MNITRKPSLKYLMSQGEGEHKLKKSLNWLSVAILAISMSVGAGIFSVGAEVIENIAGPAAIISFLIASLVCALAAMCYAEFACKMPVAGASYAFCYASIGEIFAWIIGWNMILGLVMAVSTVIKYWCVYLYTTFDIIGIKLGAIKVGSLEIDIPILVGGFLLVIILGYSTSLVDKAAKFFTILKITVIFAVIIIGAFYFVSANMLPFFHPEGVSPEGGASLLEALTGQPSKVGGWEGVLAGAAIAAFAFLGFETATTVAEETKNPKKNMPLGLLIGIVVVSLLYIAVAVVTAGMTTHQQYLDFMLQNPQIEHPTLATSFQIVGNNWAGILISVGGFLGLSSGVLVGTLGLTRTVFAICRDGLLPRKIAKTSGPNSTPIILTVICGVMITILGLFADTATLAEMTCFATLSSFAVVSFALPKLRKNKEFSGSNKDGFEVPFNPIFPIVSGIASLWLMTNLGFITWIIAVVWIIIGLGVYFIYGYKHSELGKRI